MDLNTFPTKGNLILVKATLALSRQGYELLDKKRNVLIKEIMELNSKASEIQESIDNVFGQAYAALQEANIEMGISAVERLIFGVPYEESIQIKSRSIMGVEIPLVTYDNTMRGTPNFSLARTNSAMDKAFLKFNEVKDLIMRLSAIENAAYRLAVNIKKTQKRANALKNVTIPKYEALVKSIAEILEERERDEFTRLKVVKKRKEASYSLIRSGDRE
ncbi:MAG: V-type ATP synthase subunit D [Clostridiales bacterium]|jgi:V/A-type H+-transporting ATPase subunit D|nr:V-type ATP synthase subunit D [Clostridiales bacterium]